MVCDCGTPSTFLLAFFGGEIFYIFEQACFHNADAQTDLYFS